MICGEMPYSHIPIYMGMDYRAHWRNILKWNDNFGV